MDPIPSPISQKLRVWPTKHRIETSNIIFTTYFPTKNKSKQLTKIHQMQVLYIKFLRRFFTSNISNHLWPNIPTSLIYLPLVPPEFPSSLAVAAPALRLVLGAGSRLPASVARATPRPGRSKIFTHDPSMGMVDLPNMNG